ncbi:AIPR family protein [Agreia pratensis]|uniref:AIPR family protein n=1 Tax=Agreia pratensis TaxID=150121 RepID=UPI00188C432B|nr:AIPR family protein [Agreia pratensis]MBF4633473.1 AIPR family protein [Agreia pratensis]
MGLLQLNQIAKNIETSVSMHVDVSDVKNDDAKEDARLTRGLAAWMLIRLCGASEEDAAKAVVDGFGDNGIDAIWIDREAQTIHLVQTKWSKKGAGAPALGDVHKFVQGVRDLVNAEWGKFNDKMLGHRSEVESALEDTDLRLVLVLSHTGTDKLSSDAQSVVDNLLTDMNDPIESVSFSTYSQGEIHNLLRQSATGPRPTIEAAIYDWGSVTEPYTAFYGQVEASQIAEWYQKHGVRLFDSNIRQFLGADSEVNDAIRQTLQEKPEHFWYFNNGVTVLCESIGKKALGATTKKIGHFEFREVSVVNGAQTVGTIGQVAKEDPRLVADARVTVRFISLEDCPPGFAGDVTRGTNTQNRVERRDFVSLDPEQERLATALALDGIKYAIKSGSETPALEAGFTVFEATVALACADRDSDYAVQAKREVGRLWVGAEAPQPGTQYRHLFNGQLSETRLWRVVQCLRIIDESIATARAQLDGRSSLIGIHGNRIIAHLAFQVFGPATLAADETKFKAELQGLPDLVSRVYSATVDVIARDFPENYLASLFKNATRCREIVTHALTVLR